jgi:hypothetical protein
MKSILFVTLTWFLTTNLVGQAKLPTQLWTLEELKVIAKPYSNVQDLLYYRKENGNYNGLLFRTKDEIITYFERESKVRKRVEESKDFFKNTANIRSVKDYFELLDCHPNVKKNIAASLLKNNSSFEEYKKDLTSITYHIYRANDGSVHFILPEEEKEENRPDLKEKKRIDNLPKSVNH